jgi:integrase
LAKELELKDSKIEKLDTEFYVVQENGSLKQVEKVRYNFPHCKGQQCQGLGLLHRRKTGAKIIFIDYWLNTGIKVLKEDGEIDWEKSSGWKKLKNGTISWGESKRYVLGHYDKKYFNVRHIEKKISTLREMYGNPQNLTWDKDIHVGEQLKKRGAYVAQLEELQDYTINQVIESFFNNGCPKILKPSESINKSTMRDSSRYLIGYEGRLETMKFTNDELHNGVITFREKSGINSMKELFKKYPAREYSTYGPGISLYDSFLGMMNIKELTEHDCRSYINTVAESPGTQRQIKEALSYIWKHAANKSMLGRKTLNDPLVNIKIERPTKSKHSKYNTKEFTQHQLNKIFWAAADLRNKYPFQSQLIGLMMFSGRRKETLLNLTWNDVIIDEQIVIGEDGNKHKTYGRIDIPAHVNKTKLPDKFIITQNLWNVIEDLMKQREEYPWSRFVKWLFPSIRVPNKHLLRKGNENNTDEARMKDIREFWDEVKVLAGVDEVALKMFRNTYENKVNRNKLVKSTWDTVTVTGRADTQSAEKSYLNKEFTPKVKSIVTSVDDEFANIIKIRNIK